LKIDFFKQMQYHHSFIFHQHKVQRIFIKYS
jgi:hypothetical protein